MKQCRHRIIANLCLDGYIYLNDVADVSDSVEDTRSMGFLNGKQSIVLAVQKQPGANTVEVVDAVKNLLNLFREQVPASVDIVARSHHVITGRYHGQIIATALGIPCTVPMFTYKCNAEKQLDLNPKSAMDTIDYLRSYIDSRPAA